MGHRSLVLLSKRAKTESGVEMECLKAAVGQVGRRTMGSPWHQLPEERDMYQSAASHCQ